MLGTYEYGVLQYSSKARVQVTGVPFRSLGAQPARIVHCKSAHRTVDMWAKVRGSELVELLGGTGDFATESRVLRYHYGVQPCVYPEYELSEGLLEPWSDALEVRDAITIDNASTQDRDDALSWHPDGEDGAGRLGIHITEVAARLPANLRSWALQRGSSAYWVNPEGDASSTPMLPPNLAHEVFSLNAGSRHPCRSLFLTLDAAGNVTGTRYASTWVCIAENHTYTALASAAEGPLALLRAALTRWTGLEDPEEQVAAAMIRYNLAYAKLLCGFPEGLLRVQPVAQEPATYDRVGEGEQKGRHASMNHEIYCHLTSPIRRYADLHNQAVLGKLEWSLTEKELHYLQERTAQLQMFHAHETSLRLAADCKEVPRLLEAALEVYDDGRYLRLYLPDRRIRVPLKGSFYAEPFVDAIQEAPPGKRFTVEVFGILKEGRTEVRIRWVDGARARASSTAPLPLPSWSAPPRIAALPSPRAPTTDPAMAERKMQAILGYPLDHFQQRCLRAILDGDDVLATAPTGSGKTVIALLGLVFCAFEQGKRAIITTPIKALSNQKFKEMDLWIRRLLEKDVCRVTLLTGDIQARATPPGGDGQPELLICTSEILSNKLEMSAREGAATDPDLENVGVVIMDEVHYVNDPHRGHVWERGIVRLPASVRLIALSATLDEPHRFAEWMGQRRPTRLVQRTDRHVPLWMGMYNAQGQFQELYSTHSETKTMATAAYDALRKSADQVTLPKLLQYLEREEKLPAIVFFLSRAKCVAAAESLQTNLLMGTKIGPRHKDECEYEYAYRLELQQDKVREVRQRQQQLYQQYLQPFDATLQSVPGFGTFMEMLERGIAYHHAGMLPLLREYVEILFQERLLKVVFATETLGVGLDMPCRTVVFTQLDKPDGGEGGLFRVLRTDEFWQMGGRAGRRGRDERGFIVYAPLSRPPVPSSDLFALLCGTPPPARSQLQVDPLFVLRQRVLGDDAEGRVLDKTLRRHELARQLEVMENEWRTRFGSSQKVETEADEDAAQLARARALYDKLHPPPGSLFKLTPPQRKKAQQELVAIEKERTAAGKSADLRASAQAAQERKRLMEDIEACRTALDSDWNAATTWLIEKQFLVVSEGRLLPTARGRSAALFMDGHPLVRGAVVWEERARLAEAPVDTLAVWLACFAEAVPLRPGATVPPFSAAMDLCERTRTVAEELGLDADAAFSWSSAALIDIWMRSRDIREVATYVDVSQLGSFVRCVLRVAAFLEELRTAALGLEELELYNHLEHAASSLYHGVVTNQSLYVHRRATQSKQKSIP